MAPTATPAGVVMPVDPRAIQAALSASGLPPAQRRAPRAKNLSYEEVRDAAQALANAGRRPTLYDIREQLGQRGSLTTIRKFLNRYQVEGLAGSQTPVTPGLAKLLEEVHQAAEQKFEEARQDLETRLERSEGARRDAEQQLQQAQTRNSQLEAETLDLRKMLARSIEDTAAARKLAQQQNAEWLKRLARLESALGTPVLEALAAAAKVAMANHTRLAALISGQPNLNKRNSRPGNPSKKPARDRHPATRS